MCILLFLSVYSDFFSRFSLSVRPLSLLLLLGFGSNPSAYKWHTTTHDGVHMQKKSITKNREKKKKKAFGTKETWSLEAVGVSGFLPLMANRDSVNCKVKLYFSFSLSWLRSKRG